MSRVSKLLGAMIIGLSTLAGCGGGGGYVKPPSSQQPNQPEEPPEPTPEPPTPPIPSLPNPSPESISREEARRIIFEYMEDFELGKMEKNKVLRAYVMAWTPDGDYIEEKRDIKFDAYFPKTFDFYGRERSIAILYYIEKIRDEEGEILLHPSIEDTPETLFELIDGAYDENDLKFKICYDLSNYLPPYALDYLSEPEMIELAREIFNIENLVVKRGRENFNTDYGVVGYTYDAHGWIRTDKGKHKIYIGADTRSNPIEVYGFSRLDGQILVDQLWRQGIAYLWMRPGNEEFVRAVTQGWKDWFLSR